MPSGNEVVSPEVDAAVRRRLALVLDVDDAVVALQLARKLAPWFSVAKVGSELFTAAGPDVVFKLIDQGFDVFLDLKLHDIPNTVGNAARVAGAFGVRYLTMHAHGGVDMLRAGVEGFYEGAERAGAPRPFPLAVTVLTSDADAPRHVMVNRVTHAVMSGCRGVIAAAADAREIKLLAPVMLCVVPGIRPEGSPTHDQARAATPGFAIAEGADLLVVGRAVTAEPDPALAAARVAAEVDRALS